jgi:hypothetical protein
MHSKQKHFPFFKICKKCFLSLVGCLSNKTAFPVAAGKAKQSTITFFPRKGSGLVLALSHAIAT